MEKIATTESKRGDEDMLRIRQRGTTFLFTLHKTASDVAPYISSLMDCGCSPVCQTIADSDWLYLYYQSITRRFWWGIAIAWLTTIDGVVFKILPLFLWIEWYVSSCGIA